MKGFYMKEKRISDFYPEFRDCYWINEEGTNFSHYTENDAKKVIELLKTNKYTDKEISSLTGFPVRSFIAKIRRKETWKYLKKIFYSLWVKQREKLLINKKFNDYPLWSKF